MHASPADRETWLDARAVGRSAAFEQLYSDHHARIYNLAARIVGDREDAADITQEVFLRAYTHPLPVGGDHRPEPWLYRIAVNASYDHLRRRAARPSTPLDTVAEVPDTSDRFADGEIARCVTHCLAGLTPRYRTALVLKDLHGLSHAEIAEVMDIHQGAARVLLHRARGAFRRAFRAAAPAGAGGVSMLGLAAFLPDLPVPASLQMPPVTSLAPPFAGPTTLGGGAPVAAAPIAAAPIAPAGLLAGLGGAVGAKVTVAVIATLMATSGGLAVGHYWDTPARLDAAATATTPEAGASSLPAPTSAPGIHRLTIRNRLQSAGLAPQDGDGLVGATAARSGSSSGGSGRAWGGSGTDDSNGGAEGSGTGGTATGGGAGATGSDTNGGNGSGTGSGGLVGTSGGASGGSSETTTGGGNDAGAGTGGEPTPGRTGTGAGGGG